MYLTILLYTIEDSLWLYIIFVIIIYFWEYKGKGFHHLFIGGGGGFFVVYI